MDFDISSLSIFFKIDYYDDIFCSVIMLTSLSFEAWCTLSSSRKVWGRVRFPCLHIGSGTYVAKQLVVFCKHSMVTTKAIHLRAFRKAFICGQRGEHRNVGIGGS